MKKVLLVDDEQRMLDLLELYIAPHGYVCIKKNSGNDALSFLEKEQVDLVLLDVMMPDMDGLETCEKIRQLSSVPVIMLTARSADEDIVKGLKKGADDYVTKPFNEEVLLARINAVIRRLDSKSEKDTLTFYGLSINESAMEALYKGNPIILTPKEFSLLSTFIKTPNRVFSRDYLLTSLWSFKTETENRTIDSHIRNLRDKLRQAGFPVDQHLLTVWGVGYKWSSERS
ncbi:MULTISPECIES: response regulator transcription factor [Mesobacillus]|uniref:XRE family transcriptional regulator n=1 Tax=Mesobacillus subterraneus TaxID=285983 RepID=A0A0D6ZCY8_9BACI|nr:response regulator transcription factor [Mesobacillus subterraneus]KIY23684.1 XRE family transcriptional regulator [Mesobacillus subterraneus]